MARITSAFGQLKGRIGNARFYIVNGQNIVTSIPAQVKNPKTLPQMKQRIKMANVLGTYKVVKEFVNNNFEGITGNRNLSCVFRSHNLRLPAVWLPRQNFINKCVLAPYVVSFGKFPPIDYEWQNGVCVSNLKVSTPLDGYLSGDSVKVILMSQQCATEPSPPIVHTAEMTVESSGITIPPDIPWLIDREGTLAINPTAVESSSTEPLAVESSAEPHILACAMVHTRGGGMSVLASTQHLCLSSLEVYNQFTTDESLHTALHSYKTPGY